MSECASKVGSLRTADTSSRFCGVNNEGFWLGGAPRTEYQIANSDGREGIGGRARSILPSHQWASGSPRAGMGGERRPEAQSHHRAYKQYCSTSVPRLLENLTLKKTGCVGAKNTPAEPRVA